MSAESGPARLRTPDFFVGRAVELEALRAEYRRCVAKVTSKVVALTADAGMGKSTLAAEFVQNMDEDVIVLHARCLPHGDGSAYKPLLDLLTQIAPSASLE